MNAEEARKLSNQNGHQEKIEKHIKCVNKHIEEACKCGHNKTAFVGSGGDLNLVKNEVKKHFFELGYTFEPIGYYGGIWQEDENICW